MPTSIHADNSTAARIYISTAFTHVPSSYPRRARSALGVDTVLTLDVCLFVCLYVCMLVL